MWLGFNRRHIARRYPTAKTMLSSNISVTFSPSPQECGRSGSATLPASAKQLQRAPIREPKSFRSKSTGLIIIQAIRRRFLWRPGKRLLTRSITKIQSKGVEMEVQSTGAEQEKPIAKTTGNDWKQPAKNVRVEKGRSRGPR